MNNHTVSIIGVTGVNVLSVLSRKLVFGVQMNTYNKI